MADVRFLSARMRWYGGTESRFYRVGDALPDAETLERYRTNDAVWEGVLAEMQTQLDTMLTRAELWNTTFGDRDSARDIVDLDRWNTVLSGYRLADRQAVRARQLVYQLKISIQRAFDEDVRVYRGRAASAQSLASSHSFWAGIDDLALAASRRATTAF